jgi:hypothetical protein
MAVYKTAADGSPEYSNAIGVESFRQAMLWDEYGIWYCAEKLFEAERK